MKFTFDEKKHIYSLGGKPLTGVTTVLGVIAKPALIHWASKMACEYIQQHAKKEFYTVPEGETPTEKNTLYFYKVYEELLGQAVNAHAQKRDKAAEAGTDIHAWFESYVKDPSVELPEDEIANAQAKQFLTWQFKNKVKFLESEKKMYSEKMWLGGTCDAVIEIKEKKYVMDFKTSAKIWDRTPFLQMAAYRMMLEEMGEKDFHGSLVLLLPKGGKLDDKYSYDEETDKKGFLAALDLYRVMQTKV